SAPPGTAGCADPRLPGRSWFQLRPAWRLRRRQRGLGRTAYADVPASEPGTVSDFLLHPQLLADTHPVCELALCSVRLMDDTRWPWLILVPRQPFLREIMDLA